ncbi:hypothetical protein EJ03DRAFT_326343 [Teratosphaeria nubilosa]|uniref:Uncharacterized protein n=1 Tax=Teratosphaeria nubilosa TaxID=161662 RepID=A0A6G1LDP1_9PEZI|nr:hypothetical protein EJ03DRAFT_326343 [Teratosphaeria nubilosa]
MKLTLTTILFATMLGSSLIAAAPTPIKDTSLHNKRKSFCEFFALCGPSDDED